jgi:hypothetical protein
MLLTRLPCMFTATVMIYSCTFIELLGDAPAAAQRLLKCIEAINRWMGSNRLKLNPDKTRVIWLGSRQRLVTLDTTPVHLHDGTIIEPSTCVRSLSVTFECELTMAAHVNNVTRACFYKQRQLRFVVMNAATRLVCELGYFDHITSAMRDEPH